MSNQHKRESYEAGKAAHAAGATRFEYVSSLYDLRAYRAGWDDAEYANVEAAQSTQENDLAMFLSDVQLPTRAAPVLTPVPMVAGRIVIGTNHPAYVQAHHAYREAYNAARPMTAISLTPLHDGFGTFYVLHHE